jgi:hypothetical protein
MNTTKISWLCFWPFSIGSTYFFLATSWLHVSKRKCRRPPAAQRRRSRRECACMPFGTYLYLHTVGVGNHVAVLGFARLGAKQCTGSYDPRDHQLSGSHVRRVWKSKYPYLNTRISRSASLIRLFSRLNSRRYSPNKGLGAASAKYFWRKGVRTD